MLSHEKRKEITMAKSLMKKFLQRQKKIIEQEAGRNTAADIAEDMLTRLDITFMYTLHTMEKDPWGKKRIERFYLDFINNQYEMIKEFRTCAGDEETYYLVMADRLKRDGIDVEAIQKKGEAIKLPECDYEERQRLIKEMLNAVSNSN
jgi:hypothetical protein